MTRFKFFSDTNLDLFHEAAEKSGEVFALNPRARVVCFYSNPGPSLQEIARELGGELVNEGQ